MRGCPGWTAGPPTGPFGLDEITPEADGVVLDHRRYMGRPIPTHFSFDHFGKITQLITGLPMQIASKFLLTPSPISQTIFRHSCSGIASPRLPITVSPESTVRLERQIGEASLDG